MKTKNFFKLFILSLSIISCAEDRLNTEPQTQQEIIQDATVKNGRLYFPNKESLRATFSNLKTKTDDEINEFVKINNYEPLIPIDNEKNVIDLLKKRKSRIIIKSTSRLVDGIIIEDLTDEDVLEDLDDMEEIVGDEAYTAMLNGDAEIQVANDIYKYTDVGLFITPADNYSDLINYLDENQISNNLLVETSEPVRVNYINSQPSGELVSVSENIEYYNSVEMIAPIDDVGSGGYVGSSSGGTSTVNTANIDPSIFQIVENLKIGEIRTPALGNLFGTTWVVDDKYEDRRRVKVKFYSQDLFLVYAIGCKVKHQYKGWTQTWRKENADKLGIGVNSINWTFEHTFKVPNYTPSTTYFFEGKAYTNLNDYYALANATYSSVPKMPFEKQINGFIETFVPAEMLSLDQQKNIINGLLNSGVKSLEQYHNKKYNKVGIAIETFKHTYIHYYDLSTIEDNQDCIERIFDWGVATPQITYTFGGATGNGASLSSWNFDFRYPKATGVNMYGVAKKNGAWHGVKMIKN